MRGGTAQLVQEEEKKGGRGRRKRGGEAGRSVIEVLHSTGVC